MRLNQVIAACAFAALATAPSAGRAQTDVPADVAADVPAEAAVEVPAATPDAQRTALYAQFRGLFDGGHYQDALPVAQQLVAATEQQYGASDRALVNPLANVGTTELRLGHFAAAQAAYTRALGILDTTATTTDRARLRPLQGLGMSYARSDQPVEAADALKHAIDLSRNVDGLYNLEQLDFVHALIDVYVATGRLEDAEREHLFAFRVAETAYGADDPRMLPAYDDLARWYEYVGRYTTARTQHLRALRIAEATTGRGSVATVEPLRGIARAYRLEYLYGPEVIEQTTANDPLSFSAGPGYAPTQTPLNSQGERALQLALAALQKAQPPQPAALGATLVDLADWYLTAGNGKAALAAYRDAWQALTAAGDTKIVDAPRQLRYRAPSASITRFTGGNIEDYDEYPIEARFTVRADGRIAEVTIAPSEAPQQFRDSVESAVRKALYSPRLEDGVPVETTGVTLTERVLVRKPDERKAAS